MILECENCGSEDLSNIIAHERVCNDCGHEQVEESDNFDEPADDRFADGDALASVGWGTDEAYGCYNGHDDY